MKIHSLKDFSNLKLVDFLKLNFLKITEKHLVTNYHPNFSDVPGNFFNVLKKGRYQTGNYFIMENEGEYCGSAGWNRYDDNTALLLTRAYLPKQFRTKYLFAQYLLPLMIKEAASFSRLLLTCNEYNKTIYHAISRLNQKKSSSISNRWPLVYKNFKPIGKHFINNVEQYVLEYKNK